jgi:hypothetical protein
MEVKWRVWPSDNILRPALVTFRAAYCASIATINTPVGSSIAHDDAASPNRKVRILFAPQNFQKNLANEFGDRMASAAS